MRVVNLEWIRVPLTEFSSSVETEVGTYRTWTHHEANGEWYWSFCGPSGGAVIDGEGRSEAEVQAAAQADFERRVLSCLSTHTAAGAGPVEEADAKAGAAVATEDTYCGLRGGTIRWKLRLTTPPASTIPSEPEEKGEAGAGPVGETVAGVWQVERLAEQICLGGYSEDMRRELEGRQNPTYWLGLPEEMREQHRRAARAVIALYAHPVEEPGEAERLTRERDALAEALEKINSTSLSEVFDGRIGDIVSAAREVCAGRFNFNAHSLKVDLARETKRAETAEAAFAETRERLEKQEEHTFRIVAENDKLRELADAAEELLTVSKLRGETAYLDPLADPGLWTSRRNEAWNALEAAVISRATLSTQESSAALAGDGKEAAL